MSGNTLSNSFNSKFNIYPNPFEDELYIENGFDGETPIKIEFYDLNGMKIFESSYVDYMSSNKSTQFLSSLNRGAYMLKVIGKTQISNFKIIKSNKTVK